MPRFGSKSLQSRQSLHTPSRSNMRKNGIQNPSSKSVAHTGLRRQTPGWNKQIVQLMWSNWVGSVFVSSSCFFRIRCPEVSSSTKICSWWFRQKALVWWWESDWFSIFSLASMILGVCLDTNGWYHPVLSLGPSKNQPKVNLWITS